MTSLKTNIIEVSSFPNVNILDGGRLFLNSSSSQFSDFSFFFPGQHLLAYKCQCKYTRQYTCSYCKAAEYSHGYILQYVIQHIERDQLSQKVKTVFLLVPKIYGCSLRSILVQKFLKSDIAFLRYGNFIEAVIVDWWKVGFREKGS